MTQERNINAEKPDFRKSVRFNISNETFEEKHMEVSWTVRNAGGGELGGENIILTIPSFFLRMDTEMGASRSGCVQGICKLFSERKRCRSFTGKRIIYHAEVF